MADGGQSREKTPPKESIKSEGQKAGDGTRTQRQTFTSFSMAHALSMLRRRQEEQQQAKQDEVIADDDGDDKKEKARAKRQRRRKNQKIPSAKIKSNSDELETGGPHAITNTELGATNALSGEALDNTHHPPLSISIIKKRKKKKNKPRKVGKDEQTTSEAVDNEVSKPVEIKSNPFIPRAVMLKRKDA